MGQRLSEIKIDNYKSIISETFELSDYTPLVGYNNAGKSNILSAIKWLLRASSLPGDAFHSTATPIVMEGKVTGITAQILQAMPANQQASIQPFIVGSELRIKRVQVSPGDGVRAIRLFVFNPAIVAPADPWVPNPNGIDQALAALFPDPICIGAMENAEEDVSKSKTSTTIGKLLADIIGPIEATYGPNVTTALQGIKDLLDADGSARATELNQFDTDVNQKIGDFFPDVNIKVHVPMPELKEVFSKGTIKVYEGLTPLVGRDVSALGHGAQRSIQMALIRHLADLKLNTQNPHTTTLLLIDEPELYLHPHAIEVLRDALKVLSQNGYQVVFSTHTALMVTHEDVGNAVLIRKNVGQGTIKLPTLKAAIPQVEQNMPSQLQLMFSLSNSSFVLFAEKVVLTEGVTEQRLLPKIVEHLTGRSIGLHKCALVKQDGVASTKKCMAVLTMMGLPCKAVVDLDFVFKNAVSNGFLVASDPDILACHQAMAQLATAQGINLGADGWPVRATSSMTPAAAFALLAQHTPTQQNILNLHGKLLAQNMWFWKDGAIEQHLGLTGKNEQVWAAFITNLSSNPLSAIAPGHLEVDACVRWLTI